MRSIINSGKTMSVVWVRVERREASYLQFVLVVIGSIVYDLIESLCTV